MRTYSKFKAQLGVEVDLAVAAEDGFGWHVLRGLKFQRNFTIKDVITKINEYFPFRGEGYRMHSFVSLERMPRGDWYFSSQNVDYHILSDIQPRVIDSFKGIKTKRRFYFVLHKGRFFDKDKEEVVEILKEKPESVTLEFLE